MGGGSWKVEVDVEGVSWKVRWKVECGGGGVSGAGGRCGDHSII